jgi:hypothetical protein
MRTADRYYFCLIGAGCVFGYASGIWLLPLIVFLATEAGFWIAEREPVGIASPAAVARLDETVSDRAA